MVKSGLYIVTLNNFQPISVNAQDPRIADKAITVTRANCKFGKAKDLVARRKNYVKTFGEQNVNFFPLVLVKEIDVLEKQILKELDEYRMLGRTGRKNEWLEAIHPKKVESIALTVLSKSSVEHYVIGSIGG